MENIFELGVLGYGPRLKQLSDRLSRDERLIYSAQDLNFDPKWLPIIFALKTGDALALTKLAQTLGMAHPTLIQTLAELEKLGLVESQKSPEDGRQRILSLSAKARDMIPQLERVWDHMQRVLSAAEHSQVTGFWDNLQHFEKTFTRQSFYDRVMESLHQASHVDGPNLTHPGQWFERQFDFKHLEGTASIILERLRFTPMRVAERVKHLPVAKLTKKLKGTWSIQENIGHLSDLEGLWRGRIDDMLEHKETMRPADLENTRTHQAAHNEVPLKTLIAEFTAQRSELVKQIERHLDDVTKLKALHPRLKKPMRLIDLMYFVAEHDDHHLATLTFLLNQI